MNRTTALALVSACFALGCGAEPVGSEALWSASHAIVGGYVDDTDTAVVGLALSAGGFFSGHCSGTLIAPNLVLTARHCVALTGGEGPQGSVVCGQTNFGFTGPGQFFRATTLTIRPEADGPDFYRGTGTVVVPEESTDICGNDVALIILEGPGIPESVAPPIVPRIDSRPAEDEVLLFIGYGLTDPDDDASSGTRMRLDGKEVKCLGGNCAGTLGGSVKETEWLGEDGTCPGDSGGPALDSLGRVTGVLSRGAQPCLTSVYGDVSMWKDLIIETALSAAEQGGYDPPFWTNGSSTPPPDGSGGAGGATVGAGGATVGAGGACDPGDPGCGSPGDPKSSEGGVEDDGGCSVRGGARSERWSLWLALAPVLAAVLRRRRRC